MIRKQKKGSRTIRAKRSGETSGVRCLPQSGCGIPNWGAVTDRVGKNGAGGMDKCEQTGATRNLLSACPETLDGLTSKNTLGKGTKDGSTILYN